FDKDQLEQALNLEKAPDARPGELVDRLRAFYVARGFLDVELGMAEKGRPEAAVHYLAFEIREHRQVRVTRRVFPCLQGEFSPDPYERALKHLRDLFHSKGYLNAVVGPAYVLRPACSKRSLPGQCIPEPLPVKLEARCLKDSLGLPIAEPPVPDTVNCRPDPAH